MSKQDTNKNIEKIQIIDKYIQSPAGLYTGLSIKKFIKQKVLSLDPSFKNVAIEAGRWSAYAHTNLAISFTNLLDKHRIGTGDHVLVHPLLNPVLVNILINRGVLVDTIDIDKNTLGWKTSYFRLQLQKKKMKKQSYDLIIQINFAGLSESLSAQLSLSQAQQIPTLIVFENPFLTPSDFDLLSKLSIGSVLLPWQIQTMSEYIQEVVGSQIQVAKRSVILSWFMESRTSAILEYHLTDSFESYGKVVEYYAELMRIKFNIPDWKKFFENTLDNVLVKGLDQSNPLNNLIPKKSQNKEQLVQKLLDNYRLTEALALPDLLFDLILTDNPPGSNRNLFIDRLTALHDQAAYFQEFFANLVEAFPKGTIEVPIFFKSQYYLRYFVYTTSFERIKQALGNNPDSSIFKYGTLVHPIFKVDKTLDNTLLAAKYMVYLQLKVPPLH